MTKYTLNAVGFMLILAILLVILITLKIFGIVTWSWWIIFSPFWIETFFVVVLAILVAYYYK